MTLSGIPFRSACWVIVESSHMARYGYARVSTDVQVNDPQIFALQSEGVETIVTEVISGSVPARAVKQVFSDLVKSA